MWLSRSTWACELKFGLALHTIHASRSRSTWACELKSVKICKYGWGILSRSTWACELKSQQMIESERQVASHAPRERVSWNNFWHYFTGRWYCHAPRERVSWNFNLQTFVNQYQVTLHVSVWVEISRTHCNRQNKHVTLHVSVWVEISILACKFL